MFTLSLNNFSIFWTIKFCFDNLLFSKDTQIFPDENLNLLFTDSNSIDTPFNDPDHPVSIDSKYYDINNFNKLYIKFLFRNSPF